MSSAKVGSIVTGIASAALFLSAALVVSSYGSVVESAAETPYDIRTLVPTLWLALSIAMV